MSISGADEHVRTGTQRRVPSKTPPAWAVVFAASVGQFLVVLDVSVVNVALPGIRAGLGLDAAGLQWVVNAYALTFAGFLLLGGRAADLFGRRRVFLTGLGLFAVASLTGGLATEPGVLVAARTVQGVGAAVLSPVTLSLLTSTFPEGPARTRAIATWTAVGTAGGAAGGLIGGLLTDLLSWRWVLLINVPIGAVVAVVALLWLRAEPAGERRRRLDVPGAVLVTAGVALVDFGIGRMQTHGFAAAASLVPLAAGLLALAAFVAVEARAAEPLVPLRLFRLRGVAFGNIATLVVSIGGFAMWFLLSLYMQNVLRFSAIETGLAFLPHTTGIIVGSKLAPRLMARMDARLLAAGGGLVAAAGFAWQAAVLSADGTFLGSILGPGAVMAVGFGLLMTPLTEASTVGAAPGDSGAVAGMVNTSRTIAGAIGLTLLAGTAAQVTGDATTATHLATGYSAAFWLASAITVVGTTTVALLPPRDRHHATP